MFSMLVLYVFSRFITIYFLITETLLFRALLCLQNIRQILQRGLSYSLSLRLTISLIITILPYCATFVTTDKLKWMQDF